MKKRRAMSLVMATAIFCGMVPGAESPPKACLIDKKHKIWYKYVIKDTN